MKIKLTFFILLSLFSSLILADELINLSENQLISLQKNQHALVIDIRTEKEWKQTGTIPNSHKIQFISPQGEYDTKKWLSELNKLKTSKNQPIILVCRSGGRSKKLGNILTQKLGMKNIYQLSNGMMSWIKTGNKLNTKCPTEPACKN